MSFPGGKFHSKWTKLTFCFLFVLPLLYPFLLKPGEQLYSDHLGKFILGESVGRNGFLSGNLVLPSRSLDPEGNYCPTECIRIGQELISPFPAALGYVYAIFLPWSGIVGVYVAVTILVLLSFLFLSILWDWDPIYLGVLVLASPFLINGYFFPDVGIASFLYIGGSFLFLRSGASSSWFRFVGSGFICASAAWFRIESIVFPLSFIFFLSVSKFSNIEERKKIYGYYFGFLIGVGLLLGIQYLLYGHPLGPRFSFNQPTMFLLPWKKWKIFTGLLIANPNRIGFFGYTPAFLIVLFFSVYYIFFKKNPFKRSVASEISNRDLFVYSGLVAFLALVISAPNDGIIDFGSRYLHLSLPAFAGMFLILVGNIQEKFRKIGKIVLFAILFYSVYISFSYTQILGKYGRKTTKMNSIYLEQKPDLVVVQIRTYSQILGKYFFQTPSVWLMRESHIKNFFSKNDPEQFKKILFVQTKASILESLNDADPFLKNKYYESITQSLGPDFQKVWSENKEDVLIFSMERKGKIRE
ncbi:LA_3751/LA_3752 family putative glycosyltransferase [Leptospira licerasiae]|uniref:Membrane protein n=1 Tax=Leptospira licerasiae str. MMD4847 TaxID=1049971 RepID=A0ABP2R949_9LEPT|nr:hypothetical protein [Leptospira licerasiae]EIE03050.1 hypothetical protein LEP1GSC185_1731 [Leptospira licerasiae serovar Varillal str. VAR 010]EJZ40947.1 putative membrane protein [Leptospira licerasiae str. MMD4847]